jgi:hypothetical protein
MERLAIVAVALGCLFAGACAAPVELEPEANEEAEAAVLSADQDVVEGDKRGELELCRLLAYDNEDVRAAFCRSQPQADVRGRCWEKYKKSAFAWLGWCKNEFSY